MEKKLPQLQFLCLADKKLSEQKSRYLKIDSVILSVISRGFFSRLLYGNRSYLKRR